MIVEDQKSGLDIEKHSDLENSRKGPDTVPDSCQKGYTSQELQKTGTYIMTIIILCIL